MQFLNFSYLYYFRQKRRQLDWILEALAAPLETWIIEYD